MTSRATHPPLRHSAQDVEILDPLRADRARSRAELAKVTGLSPSTVASRVDELIRRGHLREGGEGDSKGGRRPRLVAVRGDAGLVGCVDLGVDRASFGLVDFAGALVADQHVPLDIGAGPREVLSFAVHELERMRVAADLPAEIRMRGLSIGVPGPVSSRTNRVVAPSRMPGWNGVSVVDSLASEVTLPVIVSNDANLMAVGELVGAPQGPTANQVFVKAGSGIGCGIISNGSLYTGSNGWAGDISHISVPGADAVRCACGRTGCLDAVASGNALVRELQGAGVDVDSVEAMIALARDGHPRASGLLRHAGAMTGGVLANVVNFFNPERLVLGGVLAESSVFVASVRSTLFADCLPMATEELAVEVSRHPRTGGLLGAGRVFLDRVFSTAGVID